MKSRRRSRDAAVALTPVMELPMLRSSRPSRPRLILTAAVAGVLAAAGLLVAAPPAMADGPTEFKNSTDYAIFDIGSAEVYPSEITVAGMSGVISHLMVGIDLAAWVPDDVDVLVEAPTGETLVVMSDVGGSTTFVGDLWFADDASGAAPDSGALADNAVYQPANYEAGDPFSAPAPAPSGHTTLAGAFNGIDPNGTWKLYVMDDTAGSVDGNLDDWSLTIITGPASVAQSISFTSAVPVNPVIGASQVVSASATSGLPVTFSVGAGTTNGACTVSGATVSFVAAGTCVVAADQAGGPGFDPAPQVTQSMTVVKKPQAISFVSSAPGDAVVDGPSYAVVATGGASGNPVTFSVGAGTTNNACVVTGSTVSMIHAGTCVVAADQAGNATFDAAPQVTQSFTVAKAPQTISFTSSPPASAYPGDVYVVAATGGASGNPVVFSVDPATTNDACTVSGNTVTMQSAGTCVIAADQAGNADYLAATTVTQTIEVNRFAQTITFTELPPQVTAVGAAFDIAAVGGTSGQPVVFTSTTPGVCTVSGSTVTLVGLGTCVIDADQAAWGNHAAGHASLRFEVSKVASRITLSLDPASPAKPGAGEPVTATATVTLADGTAPAGAVQFSVDAQPFGAPVPLSTDGTARTASTADLGLGEGWHEVGAVFVPTGATIAGSDVVTHLEVVDAPPVVEEPEQVDPAITARLSSRHQPTKWGWYRSPVTVRFTCVTGSAELATTCPRPVKVRRSGADQQVTRTISDVDGATDAVTVGVDLDRRKPKVRVKGIKRGGHYNQVPKIRCVAKDKLSGVAKCKVKTKVTRNGNQIAYRVVARDKAGNKRIITGRAHLR